MLRRDFLGTILSLPFIAIHNVKQPKIPKQIGRLTDYHISQENIDDIRRWTIHQIDNGTRREIYLNGFVDERLIKINTPD